MNTCIRYALVKKRQLGSIAFNFERALLQLMVDEGVFKVGGLSACGFFLI